MSVIEIIDKKRRGETHSESEIQALVTGMMAGHIPDYQLSAWLMAVCIQGLTLEETAWLTQAYVDSGTHLDLSCIDGVVVDKHSTGGVGDKTTLVLIPLLAASGVHVAKLSGRGLGFTGGTVDKLEAIPGFHVALSTDEFIAQIQKIGVAISSQTSDLAPADGKLYALRDVTATVQSIPLIAASVVSKKIAAGAQVIVLDIKYGAGAFMKTLTDARQLAQTCRDIGQRMGRHISTVISSMEQPLGNGIGHTLEVIETIETLKGKGPKDLEALCLALGAVALVGAKKAESQEAAEQQLKQHLMDGSALEKFRQLIIAQQGDSSIIDDYGRMPTAKKTVPVLSSQSGYVASLDSLAIAQAGKLLGAGRNTKEEAIDFSVGVVLHKKVGDPVQKEEPLLTLYVSDKPEQEAIERSSAAYQFSTTSPAAPILIDEIVL